MFKESYLMILFLVYAFLWGAAWGSFMNVLIWRLPTGQSLSRPPSFCPVCKHPIRWHDNVPIFGWLLLGGRCRDCKTHIPIRYPAVELLVAVLSAALWWQIAWDRPGEPIQVLLVPFFLRFYFVALLVSIAFIDLDHTIIPHKLTFPGMALGLLTGLLMPKTGVWVSYFPSLDIVASAIGLVAGFGVIYALFYGYALATGRAGLGGGDATMLGFIGANLGWQSLLFVIFFASVQGILAAGIIALVDRRAGREAGDEGSLFLRGAHRPEFWDDPPVPEGATTAPPEGEAALDAPENAAADLSETEAAVTTSGGSATVETPDEAHDDEADTDPSESAAPSDDEDEDGFMQLALPFGPFLALAAIEFLFFGEAFVRWFTAGAYP